MKVGSIALMGAGGLFLWSSFHGASITGTLRDLVSSKQPTGANTEPLGSLSSGSVLTASGPGVANPSAGTWTHDGLMRLWESVGGSSATANNAACHAIQESSGNASVTSPNPDGGTNVGLWQLDTKGKGAGFSVSQLQNPIVNARLAVQGSKNGTDWSAWATPGC